MSRVFYSSNGLGKRDGEVLTDVTRTVQRTQLPLALYGDWGKLFFLFSILPTPCICPSTFPSLFFLSPTRLSSPSPQLPAKNPLHVVIYQRKSKQCCQTSTTHQVYTHTFLFCLCTHPQTPSTPPSSLFNTTYFV